MLIATLLGPVGVPTPAMWSIASAWAQSANRPGLAVIPLSRRDGVGALAAARVEEYLRAMVEAGGQVTLVAPDVVESGRARRGSARTASATQTEAQKNLDKADEALIAGRDGLASGEDLDTAYALLEASIARFEKYFTELVDFTKLVDAYARAADAALKLGKKNEAKANITKALTIQPTLVLDRKASEELRELVKTTRETLAGRKAGSIAVTANVEGAQLYVDGVSVGDVPAEAKDLFPGTHFVQVKKEGAETWGKAVTVRGRQIKLSAKLDVEEDEGTEIAIAVRFDDIKPVAEKGNFHEKLAKNFSFMFSRQLRARFLLYGVLAKSARGIELHLFLFDATIRKFAALDPVEFSANLSNMQMKILEAEGLIRAAVASFPEKNEVTEQPPVFARTTVATSGPGAPTGPSPGPPPVYVPPTPTPTPTPTPDPEPQPDPRPTSPVVTGPQTTPRTPVKPAKDPYADLVKNDDDESIVKKWWFWTVLGVVAAGGATAAVIIMNQQTDASPNFKVDAIYQP